MKKRHAIYIIFIGVFLLSIGLILSNPQYFNICDNYCFNPYDQGVGEPMGSSGIIFILLGLVFLFTHNKILKSWLRFAVFGVPLGIFLIALAPVQSQAGIGIFDIEREVMTWIVSVAFLIISLTLIIVKSYKLRKVPPGLISK